MKIIAAFAILAGLVCGQSSITAPDRIRNVQTAPTVGAACVTAQAMQRDVSAGATSGHLFSCEASLWVDISTGSSFSGTGLALLTAGVISALDPSACAANTFYSDISTAGAVTCTGSPFSVTGTFDNTVMTLPLQGLINSASILTAFQNGQGSSNYSAVGNAGGVIVPSTSTNHEADGLFGSCIGNNATTNCVGGAFYAFAGADGTNGSADANRNRLWGFNTLMGDKAKLHVFMTNEMDFNVTGTDTKVIGWQVTGASTQALTSDSVGISLGPVGSGIGWPVGFYCAQGSITTSGQCLKIDPTSSSNNVSSNTIRFISRTSGGALNTMDLSIGPATGSLNINSGGTGGISLQQSGVNQNTFTAGGAMNMLGLALASLAPTTNGTLIYCTDCLNASNPCTASSTGAFAKRLNGAWDCR